MTLVRFRYYSDSLSFHNFKRALLLQSRLSVFHAAAIIRIQIRYSTLSLRHLLSTQQPSTRGFTFTTHLSYSSSSFLFYISDCFRCSSFPLRHSSRVRAMESLFIPLLLHVPGAPRHDYCISPSGVLSIFTFGNFTTWYNVWTRHKKHMIYMRHKKRM